MRQEGLRPRKRPKQYRSRETVEVLLEATARVLEEDGFEKASTNRIAQIAGVSIGSLYQYFPNKESLVLAVFERHHEEMLGLLKHAVVELANVPIEDAVRTYVRAMLEAHTVNPKLHQALTHLAVTLGWPHLKRLQQVACDLVRGYLELHREEILPKDIELASFLLVTSVESVTHVAILEHEEHLDVDRLEGEISALILRYLLGESREKTRRGVRDN